MATSGKQPRSSYFSPVELEILMTAYAETNRKKAEARKTGGGPPPPPLTEAEKMALSQNSGRPIAEGISGGSSSDPPTPQVTGAYIRVTVGVICLVEPSAITDLHAVEDDEETLSAATEREDAERPAESHAGNYNGEEGPSTSTAQLTSLPVKQLYKVYLESQINKSHLEMEHIRLQITKTEKEIQLLDHQLKVGDVPTGGCFLIVSTTKD
ncbi:uncharacterized protein LOC133971007 [Platichthys flesus]|uniref:uncharacterized protein LOC133971007 n=1 Tax=Platichthys flesus TaxID=8260 RepID=UPI002DBD5938|nr:uncharacterized protein LOC133971007 [Platichthys flesus]